jgi:peptidoglycan hydrolase-like protein with peptidoglycan-binding domain
MGTFDHSQCAGRVRSIQSYHMDNNGWTDIAYNGVVCPHGYVFEGRGPGHRSAANGTNDSNGSSYAICYLGGEGDPFTNEGQQGFSDAANWLGPPLNHGHRDWYNTACPGDVIYGWVKSGVAPPPSGGGGGGSSASAPPFPYPPDNYLGQPSPDPKCHSGYYGGVDTSNVRTWQTQMSARGWTIDADGKYGPQSSTVCRQFQQEKGLAADSLVGPQTWSASWTSPVT